MLDDGANATPLLSFGPNPPAFASFTIPFGPNAVVFGESDTNGIWFVPLDGGTPRFLATVVFNYDAVRISETEILVSAKSGGFVTPDNDLVRLDVSTGASEIVGSVPGFSGPVAIDRAGDVYYGLGSEIVRFPSAAVAGATAASPIDLMDSVSVITGLSATLKMAVDADGDLFVSDFSGNVLAVSVDPQNPIRVRTFATIPGAFIDPVVFRDAPDQAAFEPYQPGFGKSLWFAGGGTVVQTLPERPAAVAPAGPVPAGAFTVDLVGGAPSGFAGLLIGDASQPQSPFVAALPGIEQPLFFELGGILATLDVGMLDAAGNASVTLASPGTLGLSFTVQFAVVDLAVAPAVLATSWPTTLEF